MTTTIKIKKLSTGGYEAGIRGTHTWGRGPGIFAAIAELIAKHRDRFDIAIEDDMGATDPLPCPPETVRVKIAVAVDAEGKVGSCATDANVDEDEAVSIMREGYDGFNGYAIRAFGFIEADIPRLPVVQGRILETK